MPNRRRWLSLDVLGLRVTLRRNRHGVAEIRADDDLALAAGLGFFHAHDRLVQMELMRLVGEGRLSECLRADDDTEAVDVFMRERDLAGGAAAEVANLTPEARRFAEAYGAGVNHWLRRHRRPVELLLARHRPAPWTPADTLLVIKLMSYLGLAQSQEDLERFLAQAIGEGVPVGALRRLFAPHLDGMDDATVSLLRQVRLHRPLLPRRPAPAPAPALSGSNNWALAAHRTASGAAMLCCDPHLEVNRLPAIWYEAAMGTADDTRIGITMPGVPGLVMGRTRHLAFGFTYGFMDQVDLFIEEVRDRRVRRGAGYRAVEAVEEVIQRRDRPPVTIHRYESDRGQLEVDPRGGRLEDGLVLARAWSGRRAGGAASLDALWRIVRARSVAEARRVVREVSISCNWLLADSDGHIGFQQSGLLPARRHSGLYPLPAWDDDVAWSGWVPTASLAGESDPPDGVLVTANDDHNPPGGPLVVNVSMGPDRANRIRSLLDATARPSVEDMQRIQLDLVSTQAQRIMELIAPHLPDTAAGRLLAGWDCRYDPGSRGATVFEQAYHALLERVFGDGLLGRRRWRQMRDDTALLGLFFNVFDRALLDPDPWAWGPPGRGATLREVLSATLAGLDPGSVPRWGDLRQMVMHNVLLGGRLPRWLGFDHGPVALPGGRATIVQGQILRAHGRLSCTGPSWRFVADLGRQGAATVLAGGPSGRRCSRWYRSDVDRWLSGGLKTVEPPPQG